MEEVEIEEEEIISFVEALAEGNLLLHLGNKVRFFTTWDPHTVFEMSTELPVHYLEPRKNKVVVLNLEGKELIMGTEQEWLILVQKDKKEHLELLESFKNQIRKHVPGIFEIYDHYIHSFDVNMFTSGESFQKSFQKGFSPSSRDIEFLDELAFPLAIFKGRQGLMCQTIETQSVASKIYSDVMEFQHSFFKRVSVTDAQGVYFVCFIFLFLDKESMWM